MQPDTQTPLLDGKDAESGVAESNEGQQSVRKALLRAFVGGFLAFVVLLNIFTTLAFAVAGICTLTQGCNNGPRHTRLHISFPVDVDLKAIFPIQCDVQVGHGSVHVYSATSTELCRAAVAYAEMT